jgi:hypothetical protein
VYEGNPDVGIYEAFKKHVGKKDWEEFKNSDAAKWLPVPDIEYEPGYISLFTELGSNMFNQTAGIVFDYRLDTKKIRSVIYFEDEIKDLIVYRDKYQVVGKFPGSKHLEIMEEGVSMGKKISVNANDRVTKACDKLRDVLASNKEDQVRQAVLDIRELMKKLCIPELDKLCSNVLALTSEIENDNNVNGLRDTVGYAAGRYAGLFQYFNAVFPPNESIDSYIKDFNSSFGEGQTVAGCNKLLFDYGMAAVPDVIRVGHFTKNMELIELVQKNLSQLWRMTCYEISPDMQHHPVFESINLSLLKHVMPSDITIPESLSEAARLDMTAMIESDVQMLMERYEGEELDKKLQKYHEKQLDVQGAYHIMMNLFQEGSYGVECYPWVKDQFESLADRCERESCYLLMCEKADRIHGHRPKYINDKYDFGDPIDNDDKAKKSEDWINPPKDDSVVDEIAKETPSKKEKDLDSDDKDDKKVSNHKSGNVYNITYTNSFNKQSKQRNIHGSYNNSRLNSHNISGGGSEGSGEEEDTTSWDERRKMQARLQKTYEKFEPLISPPEDLTKEYLESLLWTTVNRRNAKPWDILLDTHTKRTKKDISYRKYLVTKIIDLAEERDIEFDGKIIVAGDSVDGIYEIEISRKNDEHVIDALRKVADAVVREEISNLTKPKTKKTSNKTLNEALELFDDMRALQEMVKGGDPEKDYPLFQRAQHKIQDFNVKAQNGLNTVDQNLRDGKGVIDLSTQTPVQLVRVIKNFISDIKNRREQNIKDDMLEGRYVKRFTLDAMGSIIKTALPWMIGGPLWGTLFNMVALPVRGIVGAGKLVRGGKHWKLMIEIREELRTEIAVIDDKIRLAESQNNHKEKQRLMRMRSTMVQEYLKIAGKIHWDPDFNKVDRNPKIGGGES